MTRLRRRSTSRERASSGGALAPLLVTSAVIVAVWYAVSYGTMNARRRMVVLPPLHEVIVDGFLDWNRDSGLRPILRSLATTARVALIGLSIATLIGLCLAWVMHKSRFLERAIFPVAVVIQTTPILVLVPLMKIWFGSGLAARTVVCVLIALFPVVTNAHFGFRSVPGDLHDLFTLARATSWQRLTRLELPAALPSIAVGVRIAAGASVIGAVVGDFFFRRGAMGIGRLIDNLQKDARTTELFAATALCSVFGVIVYASFGWAGHHLSRWSFDETGTAREVPGPLG